MYHPCVADDVAHAPRPLNAQIRARWSCDVSFIGTWMPERGPFMVDLVERGVPLRITGTGWRKSPEWSRLRRHHVGEYLDGDDYAHAVQCARVCLGMLSVGNGDRHTTRSMEIPSLGGLLCAKRTDEHMVFYRDGVEAVFWDDSAECARRCLALLADEPLRQSIAAQGLRRFRRNGHTSENLLRKALEAVS
jgi:spore maturation protein CgeB